MKNTQWRAISSNLGDGSKTRALAANQLNSARTALNSVLEQQNKEKQLQQEAIASQMRNLSLVENAKLNREKFVFDKDADKRKKQTAIEEGVAANKVFSDVLERNDYILQPENLNRVQDSIAWKKGDNLERGELLKQIIAKGRNAPLAFKADPTQLTNQLTAGLSASGVYNEGNRERLENLISREFPTQSEALVTAQINANSKGLGSLFADASGGTRGKSKGNDKNFRDNYSFKTDWYNNAGLDEGIQGWLSSKLDGWFGDKPDGYRGEVEEVITSLNQQGLEIPYITSALDSLRDGNEFTIDFTNIGDGSERSKKILNDIGQIAATKQNLARGSSVTGGGLDQKTLTTLLNRNKTDTANLIAGMTPTALSNQQRFDYFAKDILSRANNKYKPQPTQAVAPKTTEPKVEENKDTLDLSFLEKKEPQEVPKKDNSIFGEKEQSTYDKLLRGSGRTKGSKKRAEEYKNSIFKKEENTKLNKIFSEEAQNKVSDEEVIESLSSSQKYLLDNARTEKIRNNLMRRYKRNLARNKSK